MNKSEYIECGKIINTHGIKGAVKIDSWCDSPQILANAKALFFKNNNEYDEYKNHHNFIYSRKVKVLVAQSCLTL